MFRISLRIRRPIGLSLSGPVWLLLPAVVLYGTYAAVRLLIWDLPIGAARLVGRVHQLPDRRLNRNWGATWLSFGEAWRTGREQQRYQIAVRRLQRRGLL